MLAPDRWIGTALSTRVVSSSMALLAQTWQYYVAHQAEFWGKTAVHLHLSALALLIGTVAGLLLGILAARSSAAYPIVTNLTSAVRAIPSLAIMAIMLPLIGVGFRPALIALTVLALPPVLINTQTGLRGVDSAVLEAALGMGLTPLQIVWRVQLPLALPVIIAGVRTAAVEVLASATIGAIIGAGGLGEYIFSGLELGPAYIHLMLIGAITIAGLTFAAETGLNGLEELARQRICR
jgi:osmoprotectant transport system permease protein